MNTNFSNSERAEVLIQALPYIKKYVGKIVVIKYGGNAMINDELKEQVMQDIVLLWLIGVKVVLVHGGGPEINEMMKKLGKTAEFVDGLRVTDKESVDIVQMVLAGKVNKTLVNLLEMKGGKAVGLSGMDGRMIEYFVEFLDVPGYTKEQIGENTYRYTKVTTSSGEEDITEDITEDIAEGNVEEAIEIIDISEEY